MCMLLDRCLSFCILSFGHCVVFFLYIWILITPLVSSKIFFCNLQSTNFFTYWGVSYLVCIYKCRNAVIPCCWEMVKVLAHIRTYAATDNGQQVITNGHWCHVEKNIISNKMKIKNTNVAKQRV